MKRIVCLSLVIVTLMAVAAPAFALTGSYEPYLGGDGTSYNIRQGHRGDQVKNLQMLLNATIDAHLDLDGIFGPGTLSAVEYFQREFMNDDTPDGIVGKDTKKVLWETCQIWPNLITVYD